MSHQVAATRPAAASAMATREAVVCGHRLTGGGNGMSTSPASGSAAGAGSGMIGLRWSMPRAAPARSRAPQEMADLLRGVGGGAQREHRDAEIARPGDHVLEP